MYNYEIEDEFSTCKHFGGVFSRDNLPIINKKPVGLIVNTDKKYESGEHWVAISLLNNGKGEYFDSFGLRPLHKEFVNFLNTNCKNGWIYNPVVLQHPLSKSCGLYSIAFLKCRFNNIPFYEFINYFTVDQKKNEHILKENLDKKWFHEGI
ncbi:MAG: Ulp1 family isopeptidase [Limnohabitans sp.]|nr:Ulp1 family isopeptidase [Limnohabitans sp.]